MLHLDSLPPTPRRRQNIPRIMPIAFPALPGDSERYPSCWTWRPERFKFRNHKLPVIFCSKRSSNGRPYITLWASSSRDTCIIVCKTLNKICCPLLLRHAHWLLLHIYIRILDILLLFTDPHTDYGTPWYTPIPNWFVLGPPGPGLHLRNRTRNSCFLQTLMSTKDKRYHTRRIPKRC